MASKPMPVRLTQVQIDRLDNVAAKMGTNRSHVIKLCLLAFLQRFEQQGLGMLPPDWEDQLHSLDGRALRYGPGGTGHRKAKGAKKAKR